MKFLFLAFLAKLGGLAMLGLPFYSVGERSVSSSLTPSPSQRTSSSLLSLTSVT